MAQLLDHLVCKHGNLDLDPQNLHQNSAMVAHTCNSRTDVSETGGAPELSAIQYTQSVKSMTSENPFPKSKIESNREIT